LAIDTPRDLNFLVSGLTTAGEFVVFALNEFAFLVTFVSSNAVVDRIGQ